MRIFTIGLGLALSLFAGCQADKPGRSVLDVGTGSGTRFAFGGFRYLDEGRGGYVAMHGDLGEGAGTNYDGVLGVGGFPGDDKTGEVTRPIGISGGITYRAHEKIGVFVGGALTLFTTYYNYYDPLHILDPSGEYNVTGEEETKAGLEIGAHFFLSDRYALGIRKDLAADITMFTIGFSF